MVTLASEPGGSSTRRSPSASARPRRARRRRAAPPARRRATSLHGRPRPRLSARFATPRGWPRRPFGPLGPAQMRPVARPVLGAAPARRARQRPLRRPLARRRERLRREELGRRVRRPLVVGPGRDGRGASRAAACTASRRPRSPPGRPTGLVTLAPPFARTWRARAAASGGSARRRRAGGSRSRARRRRRCCSPSRSRTSAGSRSAPATTCSARSASASTAAAGSGSAASRPRRAGGRRYARQVVHDEQRDVVLAARRARPSARSTWSQTASGGSRTSISALPQQLQPVVDRARAVLDQAVRVEHHRRARRARRRRGARTRSRPRPAAARARARRTHGGPSSGATSGGRWPASANVSRRRAAGRRPPASTVAIGRSSSAGARTLRWASTRSGGSPS